MTVQFNHTIVECRNKRASAGFLAEMLGLPAPVRFGPFLVVALDNGASLDFRDSTATIVSQHFAFLVDDDAFDAIFRRIRDKGMAFWADPGLQHQGGINRHDGGRGVYFEDPDGHVMEVITRPYGSGTGPDRHPGAARRDAD